MRKIFCGCYSNKFEKECIENIKLKKCLICKENNYTFKRYIGPKKLKKIKQDKLK